MAVDETLDARGDALGATSPEEVSLTLPNDPRFVHVARLVVGGLAARKDLSYESLDDLQLAVESILGERSYLVGAETTLELVIAPRQVDVVIGPVDAAALAADLSERDGFGLRLVLNAVVDAFGFEDRDDRSWLRLEKRVAVPGKV